MSRKSKARTIPVTTPGSVKVEASETTLRGLRTFNLVMGFLHLIQGVVMLIITANVNKTYPIFTNYLKFDPVSRSLVTDPQLTYNLNFGVGVALFLLLSAIAHFSLSTFGYPWYVANLKKGMNPARFYEYALSSSLMIVLIGMLVGINDLAAVMLIFGLNASMNLFGLLMEKHNQTTPKTDWTAFIFGCIAGIIPWIAITTYFLGAVNAGGAVKPPSFVYAIIPTLFVFFNSFAINMALQYKKVGPWKDYLFGERVYIILSLSAKTVLAWMIFSGVFAP